MVTELTEDNLDSVINQAETTVVQYSASWCGNCRIMKPKMKKLAAGMPEEAVAIATTRLARINEAWGQVERERGI